MQLDLLTCGAFVAFSIAVFLIGRMFIGTRRNRPDEADEVGSRRPLVLGPWTEALARALPTSQAKRKLIQTELVQAGYFHRQALQEFLALRNVALMVWVLFVAAALVAVVGPHESWTFRLFVGGLIVAILLYGVPRVVLGARATSRVQRIQYGLPDALDMITMIMSGGVPLQKALARVSGEMLSTHPDLACELAIVSQQTEVGSLEYAMQKFAQRINIPDVTGLTALVRHTERLGSPIAMAFRQYADGIRRERRQRAEEQGNKTSVKLLFPVVFCLAPPVYILLLGPALLELRSFVSRENRPGGVLSQTVSAPINNTVRQAERDFAESLR